MDNSNSVSVSRSVRQNDYGSGMDFDSGNLYSSYNSGLSFMYNDPRISRPLNREENCIIFREKIKKDNPFPQRKNKKKDKKNKKDKKKGKKHRKQGKRNKRKLRKGEYDY